MAVAAGEIISAVHSVRLRKCFRTLALFSATRHAQKPTTQSNRSGVRTCLRGWFLHANGGGHALQPPFVSFVYNTLFCVSRGSSLAMRQNCQRRMYVHRFQFSTLEPKVRRQHHQCSALSCQAPVRLHVIAWSFYCP